MLSRNVDRLFVQGKSETKGPVKNVLDKFQGRIQ